MPPELSDNIDRIIAWGAAVIATIVAVVAPFISRRRDKDANKVSEQDANTRAVAVVVDALETGLNELRLEVKSLQDKDKDKTTRLEASEAKLEAAERRIDLFGAERIEMIQHIENLESAFPNPPGAPARPDWLKNITLTKDIL